MAYDDERGDRLARLRDYAAGMISKPDDIAEEALWLLSEVDRLDAARVDAAKRERVGMRKERAAVMQWLRRWQESHVDCRANNVEECVSGLLCEISGGAHERFYPEGDLPPEVATPAQIVTLLELGAIDLTTKPGIEFTFEELVAAARGYAGDELTFDDDTAREVLSEMDGIGYVDGKYHLV